MVACDPIDWLPEPPDFLPNVSEPHIRRWALDVHGLWKTLCHKQRDSVRSHPDRHSLLLVPFPAVIPGARFRHVSLHAVPPRVDKSAVLHRPHQLTQTIAAQRDLLLVRGLFPTQVARERPSNTRSVPECG